MTGRRHIDLGPLQIQVDVRPRAHQGQAGRKAAEGLLAELMAAPEEDRINLLQEARFQIPSLFDLCLAAGHAALPENPGRASELLTLATELALLLRERLDPEIKSEGISRALSLDGTARRLQGNLQGAEAAFERAGRFALSAGSRGFFCRALAMLRWDQGRFEEASALLHHAHRRFAEGQDRCETAVCRALLGLLHLEDGHTWRAARFLRRATREVDALSRPWLAAQCWLGLALCYGESGDSTAAWSARQRAWSLYGTLKDEKEAMLSLLWLEGRVAALTGDFEEAASLLDSVRRDLIGRRRLPEATVASIELGLVWIDAGRQRELGTLVDELRGAFEGDPRLQLAVGALGAFSGDAEAGRLDREVWNWVTLPVRLAFQSQGGSLRPVPFA